MSGEPQGEGQAGRETALSSAFLFNVNVVFFSQIAIYGLAFVLRVILARGLGDDGLGTYSLFYVAVLVAGGIANLGVGLGNIYFLNKGDYRYQTLLTNSLLVLAVSSGLTWLVIAAYAATFGDELFVSGDAYWLYAAALPAVVGYVLLTSFLHGTSRFPALTFVAVLQGVLGVGLAGGLYLLDDLTVFRALAAWSVSFLAADTVALVIVVWGRLAGPGLPLKPDLTALREQIVYGAQGQLANLAQLFNYRLDQFLVAAFVSRAGVGHYTVAVGLAESVWWISSAVSMVLLPRLTGMDRERAAEVTPVITRNTLAVSILAALGLMAVSWPAVRILFGREFDPAVLPVILLMPGIIAASAQRVLGSYLFSQGKMIYNTFATFIALGLTLSLDFLLIPWLEVEGAAIASSLAYTGALIATLYWYTRVSSAGAADTLLPQKKDLRLWVDEGKRLIHRGDADTPGHGGIQRVD